MDQPRTPRAGPANVSWDAAALRAALVEPAGPWARVDVVDQVGSTNAELLAAAAQGAPDRSVLVAECQQAGRGRLGRDWVTLPGAGIAVSVLLRPHTVSPDRFGWLPLLAGLAVYDAVRAVVPVPVCLKWPNDLLVGDAQRKAGGILAEATTGPDGTAVVLGIGLNVGGAPGDLPPGATSLSAEAKGAGASQRAPASEERTAPGSRPSDAERGVQLDRSALLIAVLTRLGERAAAWRAAEGDPDVDHLRADYRAVCGSLGAEVRVELPGGMTVTGMAEDVDRDGQLLLLVADGHRRAIAAGDVVHVRPVERHDPTPRTTVSPAVAYPDALLGAGERVVAHRHPHGRVLVAPVLVFLLVVGVGGYLAALARGQGWQTWGWPALGGAAVLLVAGLTVAPVVRWRTTHLVVTTRRLLVREGVCRRRGLDVPLDRIAAVHVRSRPLGRLLGYGSLVVDAGADGEVEFRDVAAVEGVRAVLQQAVSAVPPAR